MRFEKTEGYVDYSIEIETVFDDDGSESDGEQYILIDLVYVHSDYRRQGHARAILTSALAEMAKTGLTIKLAALPKENSIDQNDLVEFYRSMGFCEEEENFGAAVIMIYRK